MDRIDEAVVIAMDARRRSYGRTTLGSKEAQDFEAMRAALLASLPVLLGPVVDEWRAREAGFDARLDAGQYEARQEWLSGMSEGIGECADQLESIYAPSLGEGDGR